MGRRVMQAREPSQQRSTRLGWHSGEMLHWDSAEVQKLAQAVVGRVGRLVELEMNRPEVRIADGPGSPHGGTLEPIAMLLARSR